MSDPASPKTAATVEPPFSDAFNLAIGFILPHEEEFARGHWGDENYVVTEDVPGDSGGLTKYGLDQASHPRLDIRNLTRPLAVLEYWKEWLQYHIDQLPDKIAVAQFDVRINGGYAVAWLQRAINKVYPPGGPWRGLVVDGVMGPATIKLAQFIATARPDLLKALLTNFIDQRDARFDSIAANNAQDRKFLAGWKQRDTDLRTYLGVA